MGTPIKNYSRGGGSRLFAGLFLALGLVAALSLSFAQLASASPLQPAGKHLENKCTAPQITITAQEDNHNYGAYQLFDGDVSGNQLTGIKWGSGINQTALLGELKTSGITKLAGVTDTTTPAKLANLLADLNADEATQFSKIATKHVTGQPTKFVKSGTKAPYTYKATLGNDGHGYYLVKDTDNNPASLTSPILKVVGCEVNVEAKGSVPSSTKEIEEDSPKAWGKTADFEIGEKAPFKLTGGMPSNIADFKTYKYGFKDFISKGFTLPDGFSAKDLTVKIGNKKIEPDTVNVTEIADESQGAEYKGGKQIEIMFTDLKKTAADNQITLDAKTKVTVEYKATVNEQAVIGGAGNPNKSLVVYQKDVNGGDGTGETPKDEVWAFTYQLDTTKVDSADKNIKLQGAKFRLYNSDKTKSAEISDGKVAKWVAGDGGTEIETPAGGVFNIKGLDADTYYLKETAAPSGYNLPEGNAAFFEIVIKSTLEVDSGTNKGKIASLTINNTTGNTAKGSVAMTIENTSGSTLPGTGGIGTVIFTVVGLLVMAGAAGGFIWRRKQNS